MLRCARDTDILGLRMSSDDIPFDKRFDLPPGEEVPLVLNLCRSMGYLSRGYYVSLVA